MAGVTLIGMGRPNKHGLPPGLRRTADRGLMIDLWYKEVDGRRKRYREQLGTVPLLAAKDVLLKRRMEILNGKMNDGTAARVTLAAAFDRYIEWARPIYPRSMRFRENARKNLCAAFGKVLMSELTPWHLERYKRDALKKRAPATVDLDIAAFKHMIGKAASWRLITRERAHELRDDVKLLRVHNERERLLTEEEQAALLAACPPDLREIVVAAMHLGARSGELRSMTWDQVNLEGRTILVRRTKGKRPIIDRLHINDDLLRALRYAEARRGKKPYVFVTKAGRQWKSSWLGEVFRLSADAAGLHDLHFHDLRHHFASTLVQRGIALRRVQRLLGHTRITTTERYAHLAPDVDLATDVLVEGGTIRQMTDAKRLREEK